jgi:hypothetical protein
VWDKLKGFKEDLSELVVFEVSGKARAQSLRP